MIGFWACLLISMTGCQLLFSVDTPPDALVDADADVDAPTIDSSVCVAIGHDEDGDGADDACDNCPAVDGTQLDSDRDGVGDACDPHPSTAGDRLVAFEAFAAGGPGIFDSTGSWTIGTDEFLGNGASAYIEVSDTILEGFAFSRIAADVRFFEPAATGQPQISLFDGGDNGVFGNGCAAFVEVPATGAGSLRMFDSGTVVAEATWANAGSVRHLELTVKGSSLHCQGDSGGGPFSTQVTQSPKAGNLGVVVSTNEMVAVRNVSIYVTQ